MLSRLAAMETLAERRHMLSRVLALVLGGFALIAAAAAALGGWIIPLLFGQQFVAAVPVFHVLMLAAVAGAGFMVCQNAATGTGRVRFVMAGPVAGVAVKALAGTALIPAYGMVGAAWGNAAAYLAAGCVAFAVAWRGNERR